MKSSQALLVYESEYAKLEHREMKTLTAEQLVSFLREAKESGVFELYYIELTTGSRRGELLNFTADTYAYTEQGAHAAMAETYSNNIAAFMTSEKTADRHLIDIAPTEKKKRV